MGHPVCMINLRKIGTDMKTTWKSHCFWVEITLQSKIALHFTFDIFTSRAPNAHSETFIDMQIIVLSKRNYILIPTYVT